MRRDSLWPKSLRHKLTPLLAVALLTAACGGSAPPETEARLGVSPSTGTDVAEGGSASEEGQGDKKTDEKKKNGGSGGQGSGGGNEGGDGTGGTSGSPGSGSGGGGDNSSGTGGGNRSGGSNPAGGGGARGGGSSGALFPASGRYVFNQNGYEEFCSGTCQREKLPPRQAVTSSVVSRSEGSATVVTEMRSSNSRMTRTTTRFTRGSADIVEVYVKFTYSGYTFEQTYRPQPPVESIRFPIVNGDSWRASWKGDVSGDYGASVQGREAVNVNGRSVKAAKLQTSTRFRGDFEGTANATIWVDPKTKAIVKTAGNLAVDSDFGSYSTGFATALVSGPGY